MFVFMTTGTAPSGMVTQGVQVDMAMKAAGHNSVAIHQRYVNLKPAEVARAFGICSNAVQTNPAEKSAVNVNG